MRLIPGTMAPDFESTTSDGSTFKLSDLRPKPLWLAFFRYTSCMFCNFRIHEMTARFAELQDHGLQIAGTGERVE